MKQILITITKILVSVLVLWFLAHTSKLKFSLLLDLFSSPLLLLCTISLYFLVIAISSWRWQQLNNAQGIRLAYKQTVLPTYLGVAFNNLLPGGVGGDFFRFYFLNKKISVKKSSVMLSILFDRITGLMGIFLAVCLVSVLYLNLFNHEKLTLYFTIFCITLCIILAVLYVASCLLPKRIGLSTWLQTKFANKKFLNPILSLLDAFNIYRNSKITILECLLASLIIQFLIAITCMLIAKIMHFPPLSFTAYIMAIAVTQLVNLIPIAPGGIGVGEAAFVNILTLLNPGISGTFATIFLAYRLIGIATYLPGVLVLVFDKQLLKKPYALEKPAIAS